MTERDWEQIASDRMERSVRSLATRMRNTADQIEREAAHNRKAAREGSTEYATYARLVGQAISTLHSMIFNVNVSNLVDAAADADAEHRERVARAALVEHLMETDAVKVAATHGLTSPQIIAESMVKEMYP